MIFNISNQNDCYVYLNNISPASFQTFVKSSVKNIQ
jgi:hypothetical protein